MYSHGRLCVQLQNIKGRILEALLIKLKNPSLNNQLDSFQLKLFQNGIT